MKKVLTIGLGAIALLGLSSCGRIDRSLAGWTGKGTEVCHRGVTYVQFTSGATVAYDREGRLIPCYD